MKKPVLIISNDIHIKEDNLERKKGLFRQKCELAKKLQVGKLAILGDVFESRVAQREEVLTAFGDILDMLIEFDLELWLIPGNHDKTIYSSRESFLSPFKDHPNVKYIDLVGGLPLPNDLFVHFIPFFSEEVWLKQFESYTAAHLIMDKESKHILCTHIAVTGSRNNDGGLVSCGISTTLFKDFFKVFSGHYHDQQQIGKNFYHLPAIEQNNFGENEDKGFTVLYDDGSHELVKSKFKSYKKIKINLDSITNDEISRLKEEFKDSKDNIRFEFTGSESKVKSINKQEFSDLGIQVKTKYKEIEQDIEYLDKEEVVEYNKDSIIDVFAEFCEKEDYDFETGVKYLNKKLNKQ